jgi:hypothetical protein
MFTKFRPVYVKVQAVCDLLHGVSITKLFRKVYIFECNRLFFKTSKKWLTYKNAKLETQLEYRVQI